QPGHAVPARRARGALLRDLQPAARLRPVRLLRGRARGHDRGDRARGSRAHADHRRAGRQVGPHTRGHGCRAAPVPQGGSRARAGHDPRVLQDPVPGCAGRPLRLEADGARPQRQPHGRHRTRVPGWRRSGDRGDEMMKRMAGLCVPALCTLLVASEVAPAFAQAQADPPPATGGSDLSGHRRFLFSALGATIALVPALLMSRQQQEERGVCTSRTCIVSVGAVMGASAGFLIGRDLDRSAARRNAAGPSIRFPARRVELELVPEEVAAYEGGAIVIGREGIAMVGEDQSVRRRGGAIRGVSDVVALPGRNAVLAATASGIYSFDLSGSEEGRVVLREGGATLEAIAEDEVIVGAPDLVRRLRLSGRGTLLELAEEARAQDGGFSTALAFAPQAGIVWVLGPDRLVARTTQLQEVGSIALPVIGRSLSVSGSRALVAAGGDGMLVLDVGQP